MRLSLCAVAAVLVAAIGLTAGDLSAQEASARDTMVSLGAKTLAQPCPVWIIGSYDKAGKPNVMTASWAAICCSQPPMVTVSLRKATYTHGNIMESRAFTVNIPSERFAGAAMHFGSVSGRDVDKFAKSGLTPVKSAFVNAPYVKEFPLVLECRLVKTEELGLHTMFIGEIVDVKALASVLNAEGAPDITKIKPLLFAPGNDGFFGIGDSIRPARELKGNTKK